MAIGLAAFGIIMVVLSFAQSSSVWRRTSLLGKNATAHALPQAPGTIVASGGRTSDLFWPALISTASLILTAAMIHVYDLIPDNLRTWFFYALASIGLPESVVTGSAQRIRKEERKRRSVVAEAARAGRNTWSVGGSNGREGSHHRAKALGPGPGFYYLTAEHQEMHQIIHATAQERAVQAARSSIAREEDTCEQQVPRVGDHATNEDKDNGNSVVMMHTGRVGWRTTDLKHRHRHSSLPTEGDPYFDI
jgi:hypothetical protein